MNENSLCDRWPLGEAIAFVVAIRSKRSLHYELLEFGI
jgi:hypothetical protein